MRPHQGTLITLAKASTALACLCVPAMALVAQSQAETVPENEDDITYLPQPATMYLMEPFNVSARRFETDSSQIAAAISQVDASTISATAATSMSDLLGDLGVAIRSYTGNPAQSTIDMRGYGESGNLNTLILVDGRRVNSPDMSGVNWLNMPLVGVQRVEVLRGSQSAFYGNNAAGGVINVTTSIPYGTGGAALINYGSWDSLVARAAAWTELSDSVRTSTEIGYVEGDGYRDNSAYRTRSVSQSFEGKSGRVTWKASAGYDKNHFLFPGPLDEFTYRDNPRACGYGNLGSDYFSDSENAYASGAADWKDDALELHADLNWNHVRNPWNMGVGLGAERKVDTWKFAPRARYCLNENFSLIAGADAEYDDLKLALFNDLDHTDRRSHSTLKRSSVGAYGDLTWTNDDKGTLTVDLAARAQTHRLRDSFTDDTGIKPDDNDKKSGSDTAFSLGANWRATDALRLWARADRFFRYPAIDEIVAYQGYDLSVPFNKDLDSEYGWSGEVGMELSLPHTTLKLNGFVQDVKDLIAFDYMQNLNVNLADARREGIEAGAEFVYKEFKGGIFYTLLDVTLRSGPYAGKDLYLVPRNQFNAHVEWNPGKLSLRVSGRYTGTQWEGNDFGNINERMPAFFVMDLLARYQVNENITLFAGVNNALDKEYAALRYSGVWYPSDARNWRIGAQLRY